MTRERNLDTVPTAKVSIVIPTFQRPEALRASLAALMEVDYPADLYEVIVVDDGADEVTKGVVEGYGGTRPVVEYVPQDHAGVATARNRGARRATGELIVFLDDDMVVEPDHLRRHVEDQERFGDALVNGHWEFAPETLADLEASPFGRFRIDVEHWVKEGITKERIADGVLRPAHVTACNLGIRPETFESLGGFDEQFPYAGCEDQDFSLRASDAGMRFVYDKAIGLLHHDGRLSLKQFGERQRRGAMTHVVLATRHDGVRGGSEMLVENGPIRRGEPLRVSMKKLVKRALANKLGFGLLALAARALERVAPDSHLLRRLYWATLGVYIFAGIRDGLRSDPQVLEQPRPEPPDD